MAFKQLVVALDFSRPSIAALRRARGVLAPGGTIHLVHVVDAAPPDAPDAKPFARDQMIKVARTELPHEGLVVKLHTVVGRPADELVRAAKRFAADLVVIGSHARGALGRLLLGSVAEEVARRSDAPVWIVRERAEGEGAIGRVLLALDETEPSRLAARTGVALARTLGARVEAVRVVDPARLAGVNARSFAANDIPESIAESLRVAVSPRVRKLLGPGARVRYAAGEPAPTIAALATAHDAVVCGTHGRSTLGRSAFGSVATKLIRTVPCPILVVRPSRRLEPARAARD